MIVVSVDELPDDRVAIDGALVRRLLATQFPEWADLPLEPVASAGTDNALYRLGDELVVRLPRVHWAVEMVDKEFQWLPRLAPQLPLAIPVPIAKGTSGAGYPWHWTVCEWIDGENATTERIDDSDQMATDLAHFVAALQAIDASTAPRPGPHNVFRGVPLVMRDVSTRNAIAALAGMIDTHAATEVWEAALRTPAWDGPPVWIHGDLQSGNLLAVAGRLSAVIDFGCLGAGDPACDVMAAWLLFSAAARSVFRAALPVDDATWTRGCGWALSFGVGVISYYKDTNPVLGGIARHAIAEVLADQQRGA
jgi:aminoglycoside phosphotransferase (APT) family kinase protein